MPQHPDKRIKAPPPSTFQNWMSLNERFVRHYSAYLQQVGELVERRSLEPKEWIGNYAKLWSAWVGDVGDWMHRQAGAPLRATEEWVPRSRQYAPQGQTTTWIPIDLHMDAFNDADGKQIPITLVTDGLSRGKNPVVIRPGDNIAFYPQQPVPTECRYVEMKLFSLQRLEPGVYSGMVCVEKTGYTVAIVELEVY